MRVRGYNLISHYGKKALCIESSCLQTRELILDTTVMEQHVCLIQYPSLIPLSLIPAVGIRFDLIGY